MSQAVCNNYCSRVSGEYSTNPKIYAATTVLALALILIGVLSLVHINPLAKIPFEASVAVLAGGSLLIAIPCLRSFFQKSSVAQAAVIKDKEGIKSKPVVFDIIPTNDVVRALSKEDFNFPKGGFFYCNAARGKNGEFDFSGNAPEGLETVPLIFMRRAERQNGPFNGYEYAITIRNYEFDCYFQGWKPSLQAARHFGISQYVLRDGRFVKLGS